MTQVCIRSSPAVHCPHIVFCFFCQSVSFPPFSFADKTKKLSHVRFITRRSFCNLTNFVTQFSLDICSVHHICPTASSSSSEQSTKDDGSALETSHFLLLYCSWQRSQHFRPGRPFEDRSKPSHPREHCNTFVTAVLQKDPATSLFNKKNVWGFLIATCGYLLAGLPRKQFS